jgi:hypothetical protein
VNTKIKNPATFEMQSAIGFLNAKTVCQVEIHRQTVEVYSEGAENKENMRKWCWLFREGRTNVYDEKRNGHTVAQSRKFSRILLTVLTLHKVIITCFSTSRNFWQARV